MLCRARDTLQDGKEIFLRVKGYLRRVYDVKRAVVHRRLCIDVKLTQQLLDRADGLVMRQQQYKVVVLFNPRLAQM